MPWLPTVLAVLLLIFALAQSRATFHLAQKVRLRCNRDLGRDVRLRPHLPEHRGQGEV